MAQIFRMINSKKEKLEFADSPPFIFWKAEGLSFPDVFMVSSKAIGQNGYSFHSATFSERTIKITGHIHARSSLKQELFYLRKYLNAFLNPMLGMLDVIYINDLGSYSIGGYCRNIPYIYSQKDLITVEIWIECPNPFFSQTKTNEINLAYADGGLEFPVTTPNYFGTMGHMAELTIGSDVSVPVEIYIDGGAKQPVITNKATGQFIKVMKEIPILSKLYINTKKEHSVVEIQTPDSGVIIKENAYGYLSLDSSMLQLIPGKNILTYRSEDDNRRAKISLLYKELYVGV